MKIQIDSVKEVGKKAPSLNCTRVIAALGPTQVKKFAIGRLFHEHRGNFLATKSNFSCCFCLENARVRSMQNFLSSELSGFRTEALFWVASEHSVARLTDETRTLNKPCRRFYVFGS
jgi:hypothetical protein